MQRKKYDTVFKVKVALEAVKGLKTINEVAAPDMAINSMRQLCQVAIASLFGKTDSDSLQTMLASEQVLCRDWDRPEEDAAWADL